jgi:hypothetical protein
MSAPVSDLQLFYARIIDRAAKLGFGLLLITFAVYVSGLLEPYVPLEKLPRYWSLPAHHYLLATQSPTGWAWLGELHHGDFLNFLPIAILAGVAAFGYLCVMGKFFRNREIMQAIIVILQLIVLVLAASGMFRIGGH